MKKIIHQILPVLVLLMPIIVSAQTRFQGIRTFIVSLSGIISLLLILVASLGLLAFLWGLVKFIMHAGDVKTHAEGRQFMVWGIIALFVMVSVWGLVRFIQDNLGIQSGGVFKIENINSKAGNGGTTNDPLPTPPKNDPCVDPFGNTKAPC